ncbi:MAG: threonine synthase [Chloroflexi bacterium]|nr:MAG: threonine synthase [Chloroflexota bacterium]
MDHVKHLKCLICGKEYATDEIEYICPDHGNDGIVDVRYDYELIKTRISPESLAKNEDYTIWRYKPLLPIAADAEVPPLSIGWTPLYEAPRLANKLGLQHVWVKDDGRLPTASFKDRASAVAVVKAREKNAEIITTASTGNAAAALSGICASMEQANVIFVPEAAPPAKIAQLLVYGSTVMLVKGTYDDAFELCLEAAEEYGWYNRNTAYNPYMTEGKKTAVYEICEQLDWNAPDAIFVSVGDGCIIGGLHKGLKDLLALGWIDKMPRIYGIQAEGSAFMYEAWKDGEDVLTKAPVSGVTVADSISAGLPRDRMKALAAVTETNGAYVRVTDDEILEAIPALARGVGVFAEPAGATAYAGLIKAVADGLVKADDRIVVLNTGNGLKDVASAMKSVEMVGTTPNRVAPNLADLKKVMEKLEE